mmetsp:Transcript_281/g.407  ORF Transcript_281/g.407 Transcript_281/m.407 type:complete len:365 (+) Transcript_281:264-1358(+)
MIQDDDLVRRINLLEILAEDDEDVPTPPDNAASDWSEEQIRRYYATSGVEAPTPLFPQLNPDELRAKFPDPADALYRSWFPGLKRSGTEVAAPGVVRFRVLCWANAGNAEDMYTNEGVGARRAVSPLLDWCRANDAECLAVQLPGRGARLREDLLGSAAEAAAALLPIVASKLADVPYIVIGHSVGTWCGYEFLQLARKEGLPMPTKVFWSNFPSPNIPLSDRPWKPNRELSEEAFKTESREWDVNEIVFTQLWGTYHRIMRADFELFDQYTFAHARVNAAGAETGTEEHADNDSKKLLGGGFDFPLTTFFGTRDRKISRDMVLGWQEFTSGKFEIVEVEGNHLFPLDKEPKTLWLQHIADRLP